MRNQTRSRQAWTIAKIELRRAFFSRRAFWVYGLALLPAVIFLAHAMQLKFRQQRLSSYPTTRPALLDSIREGETTDAVIQRVGKPSSDRPWERHRRVSASGKNAGITTHAVEPAVEARYVRLNVRVPAYSDNNQTARIYEFEVYGDDDSVNLALRRQAFSSAPCSADEGPEKALNGSVRGGKADRWCSSVFPKFLQVDLGSVAKIRRIVVKHASAGGENEGLDTALFDIQAGTDGMRFVTIVSRAQARFIDEIKRHRTLSYFDGRRQATLDFEEGKLVSIRIQTLMDFEEDRRIFAGVFQYFYLRLAIFFGCLGIFMNLFRGEMLDKTLHFWFLVPARREVLLAGKYGAGLIASTAIFAGGTLLCFGIMLQTHSAVEVHAYWQSAGWAHAFWYTLAAVLGCIGYGSVFLAAGMLMRNPIIPAAILLAWEGINGFLPEILQKLSVLYYLQSLCPVPAPTEEDMPAILKLLLAPAAPASHAGAIIGLLILTVLVLWIACIAIRRMEVSYSTEA